MSHPLDHYCSRCNGFSCDGDCGPKTDICNDCGKEKKIYTWCECYIPLICKNDKRYKEDLSRKAVGLFRAHERSEVFAINLALLLEKKGILSREETLKLFDRN